MLTLLATLLMTRQLVLAHYMPWFESKPVSGHWGWHWTMNHFNPDMVGADGKPQIASQFGPLIGAYDSSDPATLECQTLQMKLAGIDGVFIDWYGTKDLYDYSLINRNAKKMIDTCTKAGLKFSIVLEDHVVGDLVKAGKSTPDEFATSSEDWLTEKYKLPGFLRWHEQPVLLMFGPQYYHDADLTRLFGQKQALFTELGRRGPAVGAFGWPEPQVGDGQSWDHLRGFYDRAKPWPASVAVAYPRFEDIYKAAGVGPGYGEIKDKDGQTFRGTLDLAVNSRSPFIQVSTWNDWGEGTQIEPSVEFGYRDLEVLQERRRQSDPSFPYRSQDLRLPAKLYMLRKRGASTSKLNQASQDILHGRCSSAVKILNALAS
jgi:hypothetical protein